MTNVMTKAWEIAREGQEKFGGKVSEYIAEALKMAWALIKKGGNEVLRVVKERAQELAEWEIEVTGGDEETEKIAQMKAKKEYNDLLVNMNKINEITGKKSVNIEVAKAKLEKATVSQYVKFIQQVNGILNKLK